MRTVQRETKKLDSAGESLCCLLSVSGIYSVDNVPL